MRVLTGTYRYVAIGDSQSEGVGDDQWPDGTPIGWADRLAARLAADGRAVSYANLAVRGKRAHEILADQLTPALDLGPDLVTVTAGVNDLLRPRLEWDALRHTVDQLVGSLAASVPRVVVVCAPDITSLLPPGRLFRGRIHRANRLLASVVEEHGATLLAPPDGSVFEDARAWSDDRLHLSPLGHERLAAAAEQVLAGTGDLSWAAVPPANRPTRSFAGDLAWWYAYGAPWVVRRVRGRSSGDGREPKRAELAPARTLGRVAWRVTGRSNASAARSPDHLQR